MWVISIIVPLLLLMILLVKKNFVSSSFQHVDIKKRTILRLLVIFTRSLFFLFILVAIASPYSTERQFLPGDPKITILVDNSTSMEFYDMSFMENLRSQIEKEIPVNMYTFGSAYSSKISDAILQHVDKQNILLISDGNNYEGKDLDDVMMLASTLNTTVSGIMLEPIEGDVAVSVIGPSETVEGVESTFIIGIDKVNIEKVTLKVTIDGQTVFDDVTTENQIKIARSFAMGSHKIIAEVQVDDLFEYNNIYRKGIRTVKRPDVLLLSLGPSYLDQTLHTLYELDRVTQLPESLDKYFAVIIDDVTITHLGKDVVERLTDYVSEGNGIVVFGGKNAFEYGDYKNSYLETLLPVTVGSAEKKPQDDVSIVILIDISASTKAVFGEEKGVDVEKAIAIDIMNQMKRNNLVGVIAFNNKAFTVSELSALSGKVGLVDKIKSLRNGGGTFINVGIKSAAGMLSTAPGSRNIILISDGKTKKFFETVELVKEALKIGIRTFSIDIGAETDAAKLKEIAKAGEGEYFKPGAAESVNILFGKDDEKDLDTKPLMIRNRDHFISKNLNLSAVVSGFNQVVPKAIGKIIVSTVYGDPILTVSRFGLGRLAVFSTDNGNSWAGDLLSQHNSQLVSRTVNWAIGNPNKKETYYVSIPDTTINAETRITVKSSEVPVVEDIKFSKIAENLYSAPYTPREEGFQSILGTNFAVNNHKEFLYIGLNPRFRGLLERTGGSLFDQDDINGMIENAKSSAKIIKEAKMHHRWAFMFLALFVVLVEIFIRRVLAYKKVYK